MKTISSGVSAGTMVTPSDGANHPLTIESMVIRWATMKKARCDVATTLPPRYCTACTAYLPVIGTLSVREYAVPLLPAGIFVSLVL